MPNHDPSNHPLRKRRGVGTTVYLLVVALASFAAGDLFGARSAPRTWTDAPAHARGRCLTTFLRE